jgi:hypothetical protein
MHGLFAHPAFAPLYSKALVITGRDLCFAKGGYI